MPSLGPRVPQQSGPVLSSWELIELSYEAAMAPELWGRVFQALGTLVGQRPTTAVLRGFGPTRYINCESPEANFHEISPIQVFTTKALSRRGFVLGVVEGKVIDDWGDLPSEASQTTALVLFNVQGATLDGASQMTLRGALPHVLRSIQVHFTLEHFEHEAKSLSACLDTMGHRVMVLARDGSVVFLNTAAKRCIDQASEMELENHVLRCALPSDDEALRSLTERALDAPDQDAAVRLSGGITLFARASGPGSATVFLADADTTRSLSPALLQQTFDLTAAEAEVASLFATGDAPGAIGERLELSDRVVRRHIKTIQTKTGTKRHVELVTRLLQTLPPLDRPL